jgi:hypothetical protein
MPSRWRHGASTPSRARPAEDEIVLVWSRSVRPPTPYSSCGNGARRACEHTIAGVEAEAAGSAYGRRFGICVPAVVASQHRDPALVQTGSEIATRVTRGDEDDDIA